MVRFSASARGVFPKWLAKSLAASALIVTALVQSPAMAQASYVQGETLWNNNLCAGCHTLASRRAVLTNLSQSQGRTRLDTAITNSMPQFAFLNGTQRDSLVLFLGEFIPVPSVNPLTVNMTSTAVGTPSAATTITIQNTGRVAMVIGANILKTGTNANDFAVNGVGNGCAAQTVNVNQSCQLSVVFTPSATGSRSAQLELTHNGDPGSTFISLSGTTGAGGGNPPPTGGGGGGGDGGGGVLHPLGLLVLLLPLAFRRRR